MLLLKKTVEEFLVKAIYLTGFMGAGKTTIGEQLGIELSLPVIDTDKEIEKKQGLTIKQIFEQYGEAYFRELETEILKTLPSENVIITTGGGIVIKRENRELMKNNGQIILLHAEIDVVYDRIHADPNRPIASKKSKQQLASLYLSRKSFYEDCSIKIETGNKSIAEIVKDMILRLKKVEIGHN